MELIKHINSERPYQEMWNTFVYFESEPITKEFLEKIYIKNGYEDAFKFAFSNTSKFIYFIKQSKEYFHSAENSNILVKPLLIYYGMMNLIKAIVLTKDPDYPRNSGVLRHGITTRKLKKSNYSFRDDEIKIQKEGLLPHFYSLVTNHPSAKIEGNKYQIKELISLLPELQTSYQRIFQQQLLYPIEFSTENYDKKTQTLRIRVPKRVLQFFNQDKKKFCRELNLYNQKKEFTFSLYENTDQPNNQHYSSLSEEAICIDYLIKQENIKELSQYNIFQNPMIIQDFKGNYYIKPIIDTKLILPELMIYYMIMFNLGMLCRYETELWGDIIFSFTSEDMYIINEFINISLRKFPNLVLNILFNEILVFDSI